MPLITSLESTSVLDFSGINAEIRGIIIYYLFELVIKSSSFNSLYHDAPLPSPRDYRMCVEVFDR